jgi:hypothetical protein
LLLAGACGEGSVLTEPVQPDPVANLGSQSAALTAGTAPTDYMLVVGNTVLDGASTRPFVLRTDATASGGVMPVQDGELAARAAFAAAVEAAASGPDRAFERRMRDAERAVLTARIPYARAWSARRLAARTGGTGPAPAGRSDLRIPSTVRVGDVVRVNVQADSACSSPRYRGARVAAIGTRSIVLEDTLNPRNGFGDADYRRYAARFDTLVYPLDSAAFGAPTDIDGNGRVVLVFTRSVNEQTPRDAVTYVAGFTFSRDLFPVGGSPRTEACEGSNEGEYFYLLAPDPAGVVNGNPRTTSFVDSITTAVIAHEFQHLINAGRRIHVNNASTLEEKWLDEGLAHIAEELLFYREAGVSPRSNLDAGRLRASSHVLDAYNRDMGGNQVRYRNYLQRTSRASPVGGDDELWTRGAAWSLLRYLADRGGVGTDVFSRLVNSRSTGVANAVGVFGTGLATLVRDWNVTHAVDDLAPGSPFQQPGWNFRSIFANIGGGGVYPLSVQPMTSGIAYAGSVLSGGAAYYRITVPANASATVSLTEQSGAAPTLSLVTVRIK